MKYESEIANKLNKMSQERFAKMVHFIGAAMDEKRKRDSDPTKNAIMYQAERLLDGEIVTGQYLYSQHDNAHLIVYEYKESYESATIMMFDKVKKDTLTLLKGGE